MNQPSRSVPSMLSVAKLAQRCSVSTRTVQRWIAKYGLRVYRVGGRVLISEEDANSFLAQSRE